MKLSDIIAEADIRVPNEFTEPNKTDWLNEINQQFFDVVKIPQIETFTAAKGTSEYTLGAGIRSKNIDRVFVGNAVYDSFQYGNIKPGRGFWTFDDTTHKLKLSPSPLSNAGVVRYFLIGTTTFLSSNLTVSPDAPSEYHWLYVLGLCERIAKAQNDVDLGNNYATDFINGLNVAAQNYAKE